MPRIHAPLIPRFASIFWLLPRHADFSAATDVELIKFRSFRETRPPKKQLNEAVRGTKHILMSYSPFVSSLHPLSPVNVRARCVNMMNLVMGRGNQFRLASELARARFPVRWRSNERTADRYESGAFFFYLDSLLPFFFFLSSAAIVGSKLGGWTRRNASGKNYTRLDRAVGKLFD